MESKITKKNSKKSQKQKSIRISSETKNKLEKIRSSPIFGLAKRKAKPDRILSFALDLLNETHIRSLQEETLTSEDRKEILRQRYIVEIGPITKLEFTDFMMTDEFVAFRKQQIVVPRSA